MSKLIMGLLVSFFVFQNGWSQAFNNTSIMGDLAINEFMADNDNIVPDPAGEYDDWIELYNNSAADIPLLGYYLSDDDSELLQWAFPDTFIAANGYLIIWADDDAGQVGLHANFKLSKSGEAIYLVYTDTTIVDSIAFGSQKTDTSFGRYPNGTGSFIEMTPSFAAENLPGIVGIEDNSAQVPSGFILEQNFPNPFNPSTTIRYILPATSHVTLRIYNTLGQEINMLVNEKQSPGDKSVVWDGKDSFGNLVSSGLYIYQIQVDSHVKSLKMLLLR